ncbi:response regulator transcription factor [Acinetobacter sp. MB5]|uniref:response regulator transcription factor n=1 Tax=Acinetobacter sp. MB5 TaxID=2069438 RepID=UPI000DD0402F|nr:response regulator transcription factor [Acinetobacter sp. MB5]
MSMKDFALIFMHDETLRMRLNLILLQIGIKSENIRFTDHLNYSYDKDNLLICFLDLDHPKGYDFLSDVQKKIKNIKILAFSSNEEEENFIKCIDQGISGYILKHKSDIEMMIAIKNFLEGGFPIDPIMGHNLIHKLKNKIIKNQSNENNLISKRESIILRLIASGLSNREISDKLCISIHTVECHLKNIYKKLSVNTRTKAMIKAKQIGILS